MYVEWRLATTNVPDALEALWALDVVRCSDPDSSRQYVR